MELTLGGRSLPHALCLALALAAVVPAAPVAATADDDALAHARALLARVAFVDGHNDLPWTIREAAASNLESYDLRSRREKGDTDLPRLREGLVRGQFWSVWIPSGLERPARTSSTMLARRVSSTL